MIPTRQLTRKTVTSPELDNFYFFHAIKYRSVKLKILKFISRFVSANTNKWLSWLLLGS